MSDELKVINLANQHGNHATKGEFGVPKSNVRLWHKSKGNLVKMPWLKWVNFGKKAAWPELEVDLLKWITEKWNNGSLLARPKALDMVEYEKYCTGFPQGSLKQETTGSRVSWSGKARLFKKDSSCPAASRWLRGENVQFHGYIFDLHKQYRLSSACNCQHGRNVTYIWHAAKSNH